jgi:UDP-glucose 4-epimerase
VKVLVTGGAGFIGSHVVDHYLEHDFEVVIVDNLSTGRASNLNPAAKFYQVDIGSPDLKAVFEAERPDYVNHHAAQIDVRKSVVDPIFDATVNIVGSLNVIELAKTYQVKKFVYISTGGAVYGEPEYLPCDEAHPVNPICQYGASKHTVEHYLYMYHFNYGLDYAVLRYPNVYGPRQDPHGEAGVVAIFTGQMLAQEPVQINGDGEQSRDFVYVADCARANVMVTVQEGSHGIYNIGSEIGASVNEVYGHLKTITDYPHEVAYGPAKLGETRHIYLTAKRAGQELGWEPTVSLAEGLRSTVQYFQRTEAP